MLIDLGLIVIGIAALAGGGELLVRGSLATGRWLGVSPLLIGIVIVGFGTSTPELVVSLQAAASGEPDIAIGNVIGSNIGNILLILGLCAVISPLVIKPNAMNRDLGCAITAAALFIALGWDGELSRLDGLVLLASLAAYLCWAIYAERSLDTPAADVHVAEAEELTAVPSSPRLMGLAVVGGLGLLIAGSQSMLIGATGFAATLGVPEAVVALTIVAVGTSLPEMSVSVIATIRGHTDVAIGNVLGSNIFNVAGILGVSALLTPLGIHPRIGQFDQWVMLGASLLLLAFLLSGRTINRLEGIGFFAGYGLYVWWTFANYGAT